MCFLCKQCNNSKAILMQADLIPQGSREKDFWDEAFNSQKLLCPLLRKNSSSVDFSSCYRTSFLILNIFLLSYKSLAFIYCPTTWNTWTARCKSYIYPSKAPLSSGTAATYLLQQGKRRQRESKYLANSSGFLLIDHCIIHSGYYRETKCY